MKPSALMTLALACAGLPSCSGGGGGGSAPPLDTIAPAITRLLPLDGATDVAFDAAIAVDFSERIAPGSVNETSFRVLGPSGPVAGDRDVVGAFVTFTAFDLLAADSIYSVQVATAITDVAGNPLASGRTWSFATGVVSDGFYYRVTNRQLGVDLDTHPQSRNAFTEAAYTSSGQRWRFTPLGGGRFLLRNAMFADLLALDGGDGLSPCQMRDHPSPGPGQLWSLEPVATFFRLHTQEFGAGSSLDALGSPGLDPIGGPVILRPTDFGSGKQEWILTRLGSIR